MAPFLNHLYNPAPPQNGVSPGLQDSVSLLQHTLAGIPSPKLPTWTSKKHPQFRQIQAPTPTVKPSPHPYSVDSRTKLPFPIRI